MKKSVFIFLGAACFLGVFGALQLDHWLSKRPESISTNFLHSTAKPLPIDYSGNITSPSDFRAAAKRITPSVVSVDRYEEFQQFFESTPRIQETGTGSGVIISSEGLIVTNNHVVADAEGNIVSEVKVRLPDKRTFTAKVLGTDPRSDLAVIKINATGLSAIELGDSDAIEVGQWVLAVGNPLGYDQTVSVGVVSNKSRSLSSESGSLLNAIQTDAAINPGNSGGALTDAQGKLIGINSAIISNTGTSIGIGFAIPVNRVKKVAEEIIKTGKVRYPYFGIGINPETDHILTRPGFRERLSNYTDVTNLPEEGMIVMSNQLPAEGPAYRAGIRPLDVIESIDDKAITSSLDFYSAMDNKHIGQSIKVKIWSKGKTRTVSLTLGQAPERT
jgi:S1-C subfamily serine protease